MIEVDRWKTILHPLFDGKMVHMLVQMSLIYSIYLSHLHSSLDLMRVVSCRNGFEVHALLLIID
jgi:hypothetical protein